jgi:hypothetical protein
MLLAGLAWRTRLPWPEPWPGWPLDMLVCLVCLHPVWAGCKAWVANLALLAGLEWLAGLVLLAGLAWLTHLAWVAHMDGVAVVSCGS